MLSNKPIDLDCVHVYSSTVKCPERRIYFLIGLPLPPPPRAPRSPGTETMVKKTSLAIRTGFVRNIRMCYFPK